MRKYSKNIIISLLLLNLSFLVGAESNSSNRDLAALQKKFLSWKFGMFMHFNMSTFVPGGWSSGKEDTAKFAPSKLDCGQWADAAKSANIKYAILTVKHTGGWCLWPSKSATRSIKDFKKYKNGKGDIVKEFVNAFRKRGIKVGFYYCFPLWAKNWGDYETLAMKGYSTGKADGTGFIKKQFHELLTEYGKIDVIWVDQYNAPHGGVHSGDWLKIKSYIHSLQPECIVIANNALNFTESDICGYEYPYSLALPAVDNKKPSEVCDKLQGGWFSNPGSTAKPVRDADYIVKRMLIPLTLRNSNYLLNCAPDQRGLMPDSVVALLKQVGGMWDPAKHLTELPKGYGIIDKEIKEIPNNKKMIAVTFGPALGKNAIEKALSILSAHHAAATFFVSGKEFKNLSSSLKKAVAQGSEIGNASIDQKEDLSKVPKPIDYREKIDSVQQQAQSLFQRKPIVFRAPYNKYSESLMGALNYFALVPLGQLLDISKSADLSSGSKAIRSGAVINISTGDAVDAVLPNLLKQISKRGLKPVTITEIIEKSTDSRLKSVAGTGSSEIVSGME